MRVLVWEILTTNNRRPFHFCIRLSHVDDPDQHGFGDPSIQVHYIVKAMTQAPCRPADMGMFEGETRENSCCLNNCPTVLVQY